MTEKSKQQDSNAFIFQVVAQATYFEEPIL